jgi:hypothetical protein
LRRRPRSPPHLFGSPSPLEAGRVGGALEQQLHASLMLDGVLF